MSLLSRALVVGSLAGLIGLVASVTPVGLDLEQRFGLDLLFDLRGAREAPDDVVIVALDMDSANQLNLPTKPEKWPRSMHADLIRELVRRGAAVIAFDIIFEGVELTGDDRLFAEAIRKAGVVVLAQRLLGKELPLNSEDGKKSGTLTVETLIPPLPLLAESAVSTAPFPLPKVPFKVSQYWTFKQGSGGTPTLPVVAFQVFALDAYDEFLQLFEDVGASPARPLPGDRNTILTTGAVKKLTLNLRKTFEQDSLLADRMLTELEGTKKKGPRSGRKSRILEALVKMYSGPSSPYLNYYGPPGTIRTVPYFRMVRRNAEQTPWDEEVDFNGKAVFIGLSERMRPQEQDGFHTVFSQSSGADISGVEIAATAFANLLEDMPVRPIGLLAHAGVVFLWGLAVGGVCLTLPSITSGAIVIAMSVLYLMASEAAFTNHGTWYPLVVPLLLQAPLVLFASILWRYSLTYRERKKIREAFGYFVPDSAVDQMTNSGHGIKRSSKIVYAICMCTDIERYTTLADRMAPAEVTALMNAYFEVVFHPVKQWGGFVSDVKGDSMMALWTSVHPDASLRNQACTAALDIAEKVGKFNRAATYRLKDSGERAQLPTRIGMDAGFISLGTIGGGDHYEYRAVGAAVNTAERVEALNKHLGTGILVSEEVLAELPGFLTRELGEFLLTGKTRPVVVHELICRREKSNGRQERLCETFAQGLSAYRSRSWDEAIERFSVSLEIQERDGPSFFYLGLCEAYRENPPEERWDGLFRLDRK